MSTNSFAQVELTAPGPEDQLSGTLIQPVDNNPVVLIIPGSGPTDRDGNNPLGVTAASYRLLAEALRERGIGSLRIDKRGMFGSNTAIADPNNVTIGAYVEDVAAWIVSAREATQRECVWLLGHSEGGLVALAAAQRVDNICGAILVAVPGRPLGDILRDQLRANPANSVILPDAMTAIDTLEAGDRVNVSDMHPALQGLFAPQVQGFLVDIMAYDPAALAGETALPMLIVQGGQDLQVTLDDGQALHAAQPAARYVMLANMNHVLKSAAGEDRAGNLATYTDPSLPVMTELVDAIAAFVGQADGEAE